MTDEQPELSRHYRRALDFSTLTRWWWAVAVGGTLVLALLGSVLSSGGIESDLAGQTRNQLDIAGIDGAQVSFSGRDATISVPPGVNTSTVRDIVGEIKGVRGVDVEARG
ncbi:hypothetical protein ACMYYO_00865 [Dermacoccaceae bacterium W4C1]